MTNRNRRAAGAATASVGLAIATTISTFAPWATSGSKSRSSYGLVDVVERAGVLSSRAADMSIVWFFVPALCGMVLLSAAAHRVRLLATAATTLGFLVTVGGVLVARSPLDIEPGAIVGALAGGSTAVVGAITLALTIERADT